MYIYIYIYGYLINCEYFNNLNDNRDMAGTSIMAGYVHPHPISNWKNREFSIPLPIPSQCEDSPSKWKRIQTILT